MNADKHNDTTEVSNPVKETQSEAIPSAVLPVVQFPPAVLPVVQCPPAEKEAV
jgi:hypothetical protein